MKAARLEALTDGVVAIVITIMVLELRVPAGGAVEDLSASLPTLSAYALSFVNVALFWNNHHHMLQAAERIDGRVLWANHFCLFWLSLTPFVIRWLDESAFSVGPIAAYGVVLGLASVGYQLTERAIIACSPGESAVSRAVGKDLKGKLSLALYAAAIPLAFFSRWLALTIYLGILFLWLVPDRRIEKVLAA